MADWRIQCEHYMGAIASSAGGNSNDPPPDWFVEDLGPVGTLSDDPDVPAVELTEKRKAMMEVIDTWMPTSILGQRKIPPGQTQDLLEMSGWDKAQGAKRKAEKDKKMPITTSCGDVLSRLLALWGGDLIGAFGMLDTLWTREDFESKGPEKSPKQSGAKSRGWFVEATAQRLKDAPPNPGDILILRGEFGKGSIGHVGIFCGAKLMVWTQSKLVGKKFVTETVRVKAWVTADGGGGLLPDQTAAMAGRPVRWEKGLVYLTSPTDLKEKLLEGWVDLDQWPWTDPNADPYEDAPSEPGTEPGTEPGQGDAP